MILVILILLGPTPHPASAVRATARQRGSQGESVPGLARPTISSPIAATAASDKVDTDEADEVIDAVAKTVAELTSQQDGVIRQQVIEQLMRQIMHYDARVSPRRGDLRSRLSREALTAVRIDWSTGQFDPTPMLDRPGGHLAARKNLPQKYRRPQNGGLSSP